MVDHSDELRWGLRLQVLRRQARTELEKSQWLPLRSIELLQMQRLRALLKDAYESVPYYHRVFDEKKLHPDDIRTPKDLSKLPVLKKEEVRNHAEEFVSRKCRISDLRETRTAGSTSIPLKVYKNAEMRAYADASSLRHRAWMNLNEHPTIAYLGPPGLNWYPNIAEENLCLYTWQMNEEKFEEFIKSIKRHKPQLLHAFAGGLNLFAQYCEARGIRDITFQAILTSGEMLYTNEKKRIERVFGCEVYERYAASETGTMAFDCSRHSGLHICSESMLIEFLKDGEPAGPGELASVVVTSLFGYCMPLIRYDLQDAAYTIDDKCPCGRGLPLMSYIEGRTLDILVATDGTWLGDSNFHSRIFEHIDIKQYRLIQEDLTHMTVELVPDENYNEKAESFIVKSIKKYMGEQVDVTVKRVDEIEPTASGKRRVVVSHVPVTFR